MRETGVVWRIIFGGDGAFLIALTQKRENPIPEFGENGKVNLPQELRRAVVFHIQEFSTQGSRK